MSERLAALKGQYGLQQQGLNQNLLGMLFGQANQHSFENLYKKDEAGFGEQLLPYLPELLKMLQGSSGQGGSSIMDENGKSTNQTLSQRLLGSLGGTAAGASSGAALGSFGGPFGTAAGGAAGGLLGFILSLLGSQQSKPGQPQVANQLGK